MSKKAQYMNTSILNHRGLSLTITLVKSNRDGRNSCFNKMFLPKQEKAQQRLAQKPVYGYAGYITPVETTAYTERSASHRKAALITQNRHSGLISIA
eukprot:15139647-Ditylum_brightwellii.AAC.1